MRADCLSGDVTLETDQVTSAGNIVLMDRSLHSSAHGRRAEHDQDIRVMLMLGLRGSCTVDGSVLQSQPRCVPSRAPNSTAMFISGVDRNHGLDDSAWVLSIG